MCFPWLEGEKTSKHQAAVRLVQEIILSICKKQTTSKLTNILWGIKRYANYICKFSWLTSQCSSLEHLWHRGKIYIGVYSQSVPWKMELTDSTVAVRQTDHRNQQKLLLPAFCFHAWKGEKQWAQHNPFRGPRSSLWLPWSAWCSSAEAQCQALLSPSSSPTVDFPPLYPTWASKPIQHTQCKTLA